MHVCSVCISPGVYCYVRLRQCHGCSADKMRRGIPLDDNDRWPWLRELAGIIDSHLADSKRLVMGCSALKEAYRDILRGQHPDAVLFVRLSRPDYTTAHMRLSREEQSCPVVTRAALPVVDMRNAPCICALHV